MPDHDNITFVNFNQDFSCVSVGYKSGYRIFNCDPFGKCYTQKDGAIGIVEMLYSTSLLALVGLGEEQNNSPRKLRIINTKRQTTICEMTFPTSVLAVRMNRERLVVLLEETIYVYDITTMRLLHTIETPSNPRGLIALSSSELETSYLAYPSPPKVAISDKAGVRFGDVIIFDVKSLQPISVIEAHKTGVASIALSRDGKLLATASDKGTIVRVFEVESGSKLYQFRRGTYPTTIYSLSFSEDNKFVTASSATETIHVFRLGEQEAANTKGGILENVSSDDESVDVVDVEEDNELHSVISSESADKAEPLIDSSRISVGRMIRKSSQALGRKAAEKMGTYLPPKFSSILEPNRHFASLKVPMAKDTKTVSAIGKQLKDSTLLHIMVVSSEGFFYNFGLDPERGGDCVMISQYSLFES